tara:strand:+ start:1338 stop:1637 length:300 start_codon:yes stop_codon:yes gene_type:complete
MARTKYLTKNKYIESVGITPSVLIGWKSRFWKRGIQYVVIGHQTLIHVGRANFWISTHGQLLDDEELTEIAKHYKALRKQQKLLKPKNQKRKSLLPSSM